jgi:hypothetical protein
MATSSITVSDMPQTHTQYHFRVVNLNEYQAIQPLAELELPTDNPRLTIFVTHQLWLTPDDDWRADGPYAELHHLLQGYQQRDYTQDMSPEDNTYIRVNAALHGKEAIDSFCKQACLWQNETKSILLFVNGVTYRELLNSGVRSEIVLGSRRYLIWDDGGLWANSESLSPAQAWGGSAWCRQIWLNRYSENGAVIKHDDELIHTIKTQAEKLNQRRADQRGLSLSGRHPALDVARRLFAYMPRYRKPDRTLACYQLDAQRGYTRPLDGPVHWKGLFDARLSDLERDMILEGWLTLWPNSDQTGYMLQPSSVLLLYWAALTLGRLADPNPVNFIQNHCWDGWFGGRGVTT